MRLSKRNKNIVITFMLIIFSTACAEPSQLIDVGAVPSRVLNFPDANYSSLIKSDQEVIAIVSNIEANRSGTKFKYAKEGDNGFLEIDLPEDPRCIRRTDYLVSDSFPDNRLQVFERCGVFSETTLSLTITKTYLLAYDLSSNKLEEISGPIILGTYEASWNPEQTKGIAFLSGFSRETLYSIWDGGFGPLDVTITDRDKSWNLSNYYPNLSDSDDIRTGNAGRADWSPDGNSIALFASSEAIGVTGFDRFYAEYKLYLMDANELNPKSVLDNIHFPYIIKWSPNSKYIAFIGQYGNSKKDGIWLYSTENSSLVSIDTGRFQDILWNTENASLIAIKCRESLDCGEILEYDLSEIANP